MNVNIKIAQMLCMYDTICFLSDAEEHFLAGISYDDTLVCKVGKYKPSPDDEPREETTDSIYNFILSNLEQVNIHDGDKVAVIFDEEGNILALGKMKEDVWLDVTDDFKKKSFAELNIDITSLKVY